jgi:hypothetical protein
LRDELNEPLGLGPNRPAPAACGGSGAFAAVAAAVAAAIILAELAFLRGAPSGAAGRIVKSAWEGSAVLADPPPLRLTQSLDAPAKPPPAADTIEDAPPANPGRSPHARAGAPEPLIIDVQQALAALRAKDLAAARP